MNGQKRGNKPAFKRRRDVNRERYDSSSSGVSSASSVGPISENSAIPYFDGSGKICLDQWLGDIEIFQRIYGWDERYTINVLISRLQGPARHWYESLSNAEFTWSQWKSEIKAKFPKNKTALIEVMLQRTKSEEENMSTYFYEKKVLVENCGVTGPNAVRCINHGISNADIQADIKSKNFQTVEEMQAYLADFPSWSSV